jgi:hypothetical protein
MFEPGGRVRDVAPLMVPAAGVTVRFAVLVELFWRTLIEYPLPTTEGAGGV